MQFDVRLDAPGYEARKGVERDLGEAMQRQLETSNPKPAKASASKAQTSYKSQAVEVRVPGGDEKEFAAAIARKLTRPEVSAACVIENWQKDTHDVNELVSELARQVDAVNGGDLARAEGMLIAQAHAPDNIFANLARRATNQEYLKQWEAYMRMALKEQNQCRMTLETLASIKNPPVVFAKQANINNGGQRQVNNCATVAPPEQATDAQRLDTGAASAAGGADQVLAPVGALHRTEDR
jgi:hypothetical protein